MFSEIYDALAAFFDCKAVSDYLFPVLSGAYLTFVTAAVIQFIDMRRTAFREVESLYMTIINQPIDLTEDDWREFLFDSLNKRVSVAQDIRALGHTNAGDELQSIYARLMGAMMTALHNAVPPEINVMQPIEPAAFYRLCRQNDGLTFRADIAKALYAELGNTRREIAAVRGSVFTFLKLPQLNGAIERLRTAMRKTYSSKATCCRNCGKPPDHIV